MRLFLITCLALWPALASALPILADISSHRVEIHSSFTGTQLLVFGARNDPGDVLVLVRGPEKNLILRKKERVAGIWINRHEHRIGALPLFYSIASSKPLEEVRQYKLLAPLKIIPPANLAQEGSSFDILRSLLAAQGLHSRELGEIEFMGPTLFKATFNFPDNMPRGVYTAEVYLFSNGELAGVHTIPVEVYKVGFDAFMYDTAQRRGLVYGLVAVAIALMIGGGASWLFRRI